MRCGWLPKWTSRLAVAMGGSILGTADSFAVLGASAVTNTSLSVVSGDLGVYPGPSITGFPPGIVNGTIYNDDAVAMGAHADAAPRARGGSAGRYSCRRGAPSGRYRSEEQTSE